MAFIPKSFPALVEQAVESVQGYVKAAQDLSPGSVLRAILETGAAWAVWLQGLILQLLATTRAATSSGTDLDSWMADYGVKRLTAQPAVGQVTFARFTPTQRAVVPINTLIQTADGTQRYFVVADTNQSSFDPTEQAYILPAGQASASVTVQAVTAGAASNAVAGAVSVIGQSLPGIDTVANQFGFDNGGDAESDEALRVRFQAYLQSLSKATVGAVGYAVTSLREGLSYTLTENEDYDGTVHRGYFYVVVDDNTGAPSSGLLASVYAAIDAVRPLTVSFAVFGPTVANADIAMTLTTKQGYVHSELQTEVRAAVLAYVNALPLGESLPVTRLAQIAYDTSQGVSNVSSITINGLPDDLVIDPRAVVKAGLVTVS